MRISKKLLTFGAAALCLTAVSSRAVDTEADIKLREALRQKMAEMGPESSTPAPAPAKPAKVKAPKKAAPVAAPAPVVVAPAAKPEPVVAPQVAAPAAPVVAAPVVAQPAVAPADQAEADRLREALRARIQQEAVAPTQPATVVTHGSDLQPAVSSTQIVAPAAPVQAEPAAPAQPIVEAPKGPAVLETPASPLPMSKEARLAALLQRYKADLISPQEYHEERAKILAE